MSSILEDDKDFDPYPTSSEIEIEQKPIIGKHLNIQPAPITFPKHYKMRIDSMTLPCCDPGPAGLFSLCIGCCILLAADFGITNSTLLLRVPWLFFVPGIAQLTSGILEVFRKNTFGSFAFVIYGALWCGLSWTYLHILYADVEEPHEDLKHFGVICIGYLIFSLILFIASLGINKTFPVILFFISFALLFLILNIFFGVSAIPVAIGLLIVAIFSYYTGFAFLFNQFFNRPVLNTGKPFVDWEKRVKNN
ncbi:inner membrane protein yaah [Anaeramoeba flamelloides]|uniref:Inner membrane protein yaah n=1 Tax=Anaeramoeba flamelloides TaxID=1746091 RepID=A0AAV7Z6R5_9EUKA|nr:inner membrane protein yaah [Anaeramoeba flamelloides]